MLSVCLLPLAGEAPATLVEALRRDALTVELAGALLPDAPPAPLILALLPPGSGEAQLARLVRWRGRRPGALLLGCAPDGGPEDCVRGLEAGFDDFAAGRVSTRELSARLRALARHREPVARPGKLTAGALILDPAGRVLWAGGRRARLTRLESLALAELMLVAGRTLTRAGFLDHVWGPTAERSPRILDNLVQRLRRHLGGDASIVTVRGVGFRLDA